MSTAAASKVLRNAYGVSPAMAERVRASMDELGYRPNAAARSMRGRSFTIGLLVDNIHNPFYADILDGMSAALEHTDFQVLTGAGGVSAHGQARMADAMIDRAMDGVVLVAPHMSRTQVAARAKILPTVVVGHHDVSGDYDSVVNDDLTGATLVVDHLVALGHRRIAHTSATTGKGGWRGRPEQVRSDGYAQAMRRHGLDEYVHMVATSYTEDGGYEAACRLLDQSPRPTAIFAGADIAALGVLRAAAERGLRVPEDLAVTGYDNTAIASLDAVSLTSVDQAGGDIGATAARLLRERIEGRSRSQLSSTSPQLLVRATSAPPNTEGRAPSGRWHGRSQDRLRTTQSTKE